MQSTMFLFLACLSLQRLVVVAQTNNLDWNQFGVALTGIEPYENFGDTLAMSADGTSIMIGAPFNDKYFGSVRIFQNDSSGTTFEQIGSDITSELSTSDIRFGYSVAMSGDGTTIAVGTWAPLLFTPGYVRVFQNDSSISSFYNQIGSDINGYAPDYEFGWPMVMSGDGSTIVVGATFDDNGGYRATHFRIFQKNSSNPEYKQIGQNIYFAAKSLAISYDGSTIAAGAPYNNDNGALSGTVRVYQKDLSDMTYKPIGMPISGIEYDLLGWSLAMSDDGNTIAVGTYIAYNSNDAGYIRIFQKNLVTQNYDQIGPDIIGDPSSGFRFSLAISGDGTTVAVGATLGGTRSKVRVYKLDPSNQSYNQIGSALSSDNRCEEFGWSLAISNDGSTIAVGAPRCVTTRDVGYPGIVRVYTYSPTTPCGRFGWSIFCPGTFLATFGRFLRRLFGLSE